MRAAQVRDLLDVYEVQGPGKLEALKAPQLTWDQVGTAVCMEAQRGDKDGKLLQHSVRTQHLCKHRYAL